MPVCRSRSAVTAADVFAAIAEAAVDGALDRAGGGVAPETLASEAYLDCSVALVRRHCITLLATGYVEGHAGKNPETDLPRQSFLPSIALRPASAGSVYDHRR